MPIAQPIDGLADPGAVAAKLVAAKVALHLDKKPTNSGDFPTANQM